MSEVASLGSLVNALNAVRHDYNEQLKSIAQYEAFLMVESSAQRVAETLNGLVNSSAPSMAAEVISTLELAKTKFKEHLTSVPEYRALLAIDKLISEVSIDLGVQPAPATALAADEPETVSHEIASTQPDPGQLVPASDDAVAPLEVAEVASPEAVTAQHQTDLPVAALEPTIAQPEIAEIAPTHQSVAVQPESDQVVSASPDQAVPAPEQAVPQPVTAEVALAQPTAAEHDEPPATVSSANGSQAPAEDVPSVTEPPPTPFGEGSEKAA
jgi:hypothetical protein